MPVRRAIDSDIPCVAPMVDKLAALHERWDPGRYDYKPHPGQMYMRWLAERAVDPRSVFLVAEHEQCVKDSALLIGFVVGTIEHSIPIYRREQFGFIHDLWVEEDYRNEGVGRQLVMSAVEAFRQIGITQLRLETASANDPARALFTRCGFRSASVEMLMELD